jgi:hypothetical protein
MTERKAEHGNFIPPYTPRKRPHPYFDRSWQEQITLMMQLYRGYVIDGSALMVHPFSPDWYVMGQRFGAGPP